MSSILLKKLGEDLINWGEGNIESLPNKTVPVYHNIEKWLMEQSDDGLTIIPIHCVNRLESASVQPLLTKLLLWPSRVSSNWDFYSKQVDYPIAHPDFLPRAAYEIGLTLADDESKETYWWGNSEYALRHQDLCKELGEALLTGNIITKATFEEHQWANEEE